MLEINNSSNAGLVIDAGNGTNAYIDFNEAGVTRANIYFDGINDQLSINSFATNTILNQAGGNVGIGTASPAYKMDVDGGFFHTTFNTASLPVSDAGGGLAIGWNASGGGAEVNLYNVYEGGVNAFQFSKKTGATTSTDLMSISNSGNVGIGTVSPTALLSVNGTANKVGGGSWAVFSDARLKKNVNTYNDGLSTLLKIKTKTFQYNGKAGIKDTEKEYVGIIAQDIQKIAPYMVREVSVEDDVSKEKETYLEFDPSALDFMIINATQEQQKLINKQQAEIDELKRLVNQLMNK